MEALEENKKCSGIKFSIKQKGEEVGRAYLYLMYNDLHDEPFGFLEDVFVAESARGMGIGTNLTKSVIKKAKELGCYKLIATSRNSRSNVHSLYKKIGFKDYGKEFRIDYL